MRVGKEEIIVGGKVVKVRIKELGDSGDRNVKVMDRKNREEI